MSSSSSLMPSSSLSSDSDVTRQPVTYPLDPQTPQESMTEDPIRNMYGSSTSAGGDRKVPKTLNEVWKEITIGGSGLNGAVMLEEYLNGEDVRVPTAHKQMQGFGKGDESVGRGNVRKRSVLDETADHAAMQRQKRMIKNRESEARSRERKQAYTVKLEK